MSVEGLRQALRGTSQPCVAFQVLPEFLIKELSYHNLELERNRLEELGVKQRECVTAHRRDG